MSLSTAIAVAAAAATFTASSGTARAAQRPVAAWPTTSLRVAVDPGLGADAPEIRTAVAAINRLHIVSLTETAPGTRADIVIVPWKAPALGGLPRGVIGRTLAAHRGGRIVGPVSVFTWALRDRATVQRFAPQVTTMITHELLHALGLPHDDGGCATMNTTSMRRRPSGCPRPGAGTWRCRLIEPRDRDALRALYGGPRVAVSQVTSCPLPPAAFVTTTPLPAVLAGPAR